MQVAGQVGFLNRRWQFAERAKGKQVLHAAKRLTIAQRVFLRPGWQRALVPARGRLAHRQETETGRAEVVRGLAVNRAQEFPEESQRRGLGRRSARAEEDALPKAAG